MTYRDIVQNKEIQEYYEEYVPHFYKDNDQYGLECAVCGEQCLCGAIVRLVRLG